MLENPMNFSKLLFASCLIILLNYSAFASDQGYGPPPYATPTQLSNETIRATSAETNLLAQIVTETNRAYVAETNLDAMIRSETNRAYISETNLQEQIYLNDSSISNLESTFETFSTTTLLPVNGTSTITYIHGPLIRIIADSTPLTLTFDNSTYPTNGINRVAIELFAGTNTIQFNTMVISNNIAPTILTNAWTSLLFRKSMTNLWFGRQ